MVLELAEILSQPRYSMLIINNKIIANLAKIVKEKTK